MASSVLAEIEVRGDEVRLDGERRLEAGDRLIGAAQRVQRHAHVVLRAGVAGTQFERALKRRELP